VIKCLSSESSVAAYCRAANINPSSFYQWKTIFIAAGTKDLKRRKQNYDKAPPENIAVRQQSELISINKEYSEFQLAITKNNKHLANKSKLKLIGLISDSKIPKTKICKNLGIPRGTYYRWCRRLRETETLETASKHSDKLKPYEDEDIKSAVFKVLHAPPSKYNINRTTWTYAYLQQSISWFEHWPITAGYCPKLAAFSFNHYSQQMNGCTSPSI